MRPAGVDESLLAGETGEAAAERLALLKARTVAAGEARPVLAADTVVLCDGAVLGKPADDREAAAMLRRLSGREHAVVTGVCVAWSGRLGCGTERTVVRFAPLSEEAIAWYVATGEPRDKAGAYHIDGRAALFIEAVSGSPSNVAGLPVRLLARLVREVGAPLDLAF